MVVRVCRNYMNQNYVIDLFVIDELCVEENKVNNCYPRTQPGLQTTDVVKRKIARRTTGAKDFYLVQGIDAPGCAENVVYQEIQYQFD